MWAGWPPNRFVLHPVNAAYGRVSLYTHMLSYRGQVDRINDSPFKLNITGGGPLCISGSGLFRWANVPCVPIYTWYACDSGGSIYSHSVAYKGLSAGEFNGGAGFTIRLSDSGMMSFTVSRYHYAYTGSIPTTLLAITYGLRIN
jgi:hypothetical protein